MFKILSLFLFLMWNANASENESYLKPLSVDAQQAAYDALYEKHGSALLTAEDAHTVPILEYIPLAQQGIDYVRYYYAHHKAYKDSPIASIVLESCNKLEKELDAKRSTGLTVVELLLFNTKLASTQEIYPEGYPKDLYDKTRELFEDESWRNVPFYDYQSSILYEKEIKKLSLAGLKPYILYTHHGAFSMKRFVKQFCKPDGTNRPLIGLPIGEIPLKKSPHGFDGSRFPLGFLTHEFYHIHMIYGAVNTWEFINRLNFTEEMLNDDIITTALFLGTHEVLYHLSACSDREVSIESCIAATKKVLIDNILRDCTASIEQQDSFRERLSRITHTNLNNALHELREISKALNSSYKITSLLEFIIDYKYNFEILEKGDFCANSVGGEFTISQFENGKNRGTGSFNIAFDIVPTESLFEFSIKFGDISMTNQDQSSLPQAIIDEILNLARRTHLTDSFYARESDEFAQNNSMLKALNRTFEYYNFVANGRSFDFWDLNDDEREILKLTLGFELFDAFQEKLREYGKLNSLF